MEIEIIRPKQFADKMRDYHLWADDREIAVIKPNSTQTIQLPEGVKSLRATIDWCSSPEFGIDNFQGNKLVVKNSFAGGIVRALVLPLYYVTFGRDKYLKIENIA